MYREGEKEKAAGPATQSWVGGGGGGRGDGVDMDVNADVLNVFKQKKEKKTIKM